MRQPFTKMQGAGNDFVVLDGTRAPLALSRAQLQRLGDRRLGVGADQILLVEAADGPQLDFRYRIFNGASGDEVEHCGNGARCFVRYVREHGLTDKSRIRVQTLNRVLDLTEEADGRVSVDMGEPDFAPASLPFDSAGLAMQRVGDLTLWSLPLGGAAAGVQIGAVSMGNPHAVQRVSDVDVAPVTELGPRIEQHPRFARRVNAGFMQVLARGHLRLRVWERDAGETLACGTGACAAVAAGIQAGWLDAGVEVDTRGGRLRIDWAGPGHALRMSGPALTVFEGEIEL